MNRPAARRSPAWFVIWAGLLTALTTVFTLGAVWVWAHPNTAWWVLMVVLVPATLAGNRWSKQKEKEHARQPH